MMVGRRVDLNIDRPDPENPHMRLKVEHVTVVNEEMVKLLDDVSFTANSG